MFFWKTSSANMSSPFHSVTYRGAEQRISRYIGDVPSVATRGHSRVGLPGPMYCFLSLLVGREGGRGSVWGVVREIQLA